jgi:hypothetical protein
MEARKLPSLAGVAFVLLVVVAVVGFGRTTPGNDDSAASIASFYDQHMARQVTASFLIAASVPFLLIFAAVLAEALSPPDRSRRPWWTLVLVGGSILAGSTALLVALVHFALTDGADTGIRGEALRALVLLDNDFWVAFNAALGVMMLGAAASLLTSGWGARWLGWSALVLGVALFIPVADFFALLISGVWIIVTSVMLYRGTEPVPQPVTA